MEHRRAYYPRLWPLMLSGAVMVSTVGFVIDDTWVTIAAGFVAGAVLGAGRLWLWRRRHPIIQPEEYLADLRAKARWN